jgi:2-oxoglutarate dehydrogenase E1 component
VQEEPKNMGAWTYMEPRLRDLLGGDLPLRYVGKPARPNPAQGSSRFHKEEHAEIVRRAFDEDEHEGKGEAAAASMQERAPTASE